MDLIEKNIEISDSSQQGKNFKFSSSIKSPCHVFVVIISDANTDAVPSANPFLYNTFSVSTDAMKLFSCHLEVGNGNEYPEIHYTPSTDMTHVYRGVLKLMSIKIMNTVKGHYSTEVISVPYFLSYFFDLTKQKWTLS